MTVQELLQSIGDNPVYVLVYFALLPALALLIGWLDGERGEDKISYAYTYGSSRYAMPRTFSSTRFM